MYVFEICGEIIKPKYFYFEKKNKKKQFYLELCTFLYQVLQIHSLYLIMMSVGCVHLKLEFSRKKKIVDGPSFSVSTLGGNHSKK